MHIMHVRPRGIFNIHPRSTLQRCSLMRVEKSIALISITPKSCVSWCCLVLEIASAAAAGCASRSRRQFTRRHAAIYHIHPCILKVNQPRLQISRRREQKRQLIAHSFAFCSSSLGESFCFGTRPLNMLNILSSASVTHIESIQIKIWGLD
jgi:hypothetical protein